MEMFKVLLYLIINSEWFKRYMNYRLIIKSLKKHHKSYYKKVRYLWWFDKKALNAFMKNLDTGQTVESAYNNAVNRNKKLITSVTLGESQTRAQKNINNVIIPMNEKYEKNHKKDDITFV